MWSKITQILLTTFKVKIHAFIISSEHITYYHVIKHKMQCTSLCRKSRFYGYIIIYSIRHLFNPRRVSNKLFNNTMLINKKNIYLVIRLDRVTCNAVKWTVDLVRYQARRLLVVARTQYIKKYRRNCIPHGKLLKRSSCATTLAVSWICCYISLLGGSTPFRVTATHSYCKYRNFGRTKSSVHHANLQLNI